jgi:hypothetical protein
MKRIGYILLAVMAVGILGYLTYTKEYHSRYHLDTLREERFITTRIIGIPVWRSEREPSDRFSDAYRKIVGSEPDTTHWKVMPPDYIRSRGRGGYKCYGFGMEIHERMYLLRTVFERFEKGMSQETAAELVRSIDVVLPARPKNGQELDFEGIDEVRKKLGLETWGNQEEPNKP